MWRALMWMTVVLSLGFAAPAWADDEATIKKLVKQAERAAFEAHKLDEWAPAFKADAIFEHGRRAVADAHDLTFDLAAEKRVRGLRVSDAATGKDRLYFESESLEIKGDTAVFESDVVRHFFGGKDVYRYRLTLEKNDGTWLIARWRAWPLRQNISGISTIYDDATWLEADEKAAKTDETPEIRFNHLVEALQIKLALDFAKTQTRGAGKADALWFARVGHLSAVMGDMKSARTAISAARKIDKHVDVPTFLSDYLAKKR